MRLIDANIFEEIFKRDFCYDCNSYNEIRCRNCQRACLVNDVLLELDDTPTVDTVPVVRCEDCKYDEQCLLQSFIRDNSCDNVPYTKDWFCADGKGKIDEIN